MFKVGYVFLGIILLTGVVLTGCESASAGAKNGDMVQVNYTGKLTDGTVFDSSVGRAPLEFTLGNDETIPGFEKAVLGMKVGEKKTVTIPADEAYPYFDELVIAVPRERIRTEAEPVVGQVLSTTGPDGEEIRFTITNISDNGTVTLDGNYALAGKDLTFDIELLKIE